MNLQNPSHQRENGGVEELEPCIDQPEMGRRTQAGPRTVDGWMPHLKIGKVVRFHWPEVIQHLKANHRYNRRVRLPEVPV